MTNASMERRFRKVRKGATALLTLAICLPSTTHVAFGQSIDPIRTVVPVHFDATTGNISLGVIDEAQKLNGIGPGTIYLGANPGFHVLALSRQPNIDHLDMPDKIWDQTYTDAAGVNSALQSILQQCANCLLMVNAAGNHGITLNSVAEQLAKFGSYPDLQQLTGVAPLIFVGVGGAHANSALQRGGGTRNIDAYLAQDSNGNYAFIQLDFVRYDITTDGTITIGGTAHKAADAGYRPGCDAAASDSLHLLVVDRESPDVVLNDNVYCTRQRTDLLAGMAGDLNGINTEGALVFIATNGHPIPPDWNFNSGGDLRVFVLARQMARLGGYYETMAYVTSTDTYSLVGAVAPPSYVARARDRAKEGSSVYPADVNGKTPTGELHGVLSRGRGNWYSPLNADPSGRANLQLYELLAQPKTTYPQFTGDQLTAYNTIISNLTAKKLCASPNCIRSAFDSLNLDLNATYLTPIGLMLDPSGADCDRSGNEGLPFCQVRSELQTEITNAINVQKLYSNMKDLWLAKGTTSIGASLSAYDDVKSTLPTLATAESPSLVRPLVSFFLGLAGNIPVIGQAFGLAATGFNLGMDLATDNKGNKQVDLTSTIGQLEQQAVDHFIAEGATIGTMFQVVMEDYGKLTTLGNKLVQQNDPGSPWHWDFDTTTQVTQQLTTAVKQAAYQNIMAAAYSIGSYLPQSAYNCYGTGPNPVWGGFPLWQQPRSYVVLDTSYNCGNLGNTPAVTPFAPPGAAVYIPYTFPNDPNNPWANDAHTGTMMADFTWLAISLQGSASNSGSAAHYDPPDPTLLSSLFTPQAKNDDRGNPGLGVYRPAFFEGWPFPRVTCDPSYGVYPPGSPGMAIGGCNWAAGAPPTQSVPGPPRTGITIHANQVSTNQTQVKLLLSVFNSGTEQANSIDFTSITLRTLGGSGQAILISPALPARVISLAPGDSTNVAVTLNIPSGITKLGITEQGSIDTGAQQLTQFSEAQVLYPQR